MAHAHPTYLERQFAADGLALDASSHSVGREPATDLLALFEAMKRNIAASAPSAPEPVTYTCPACRDTGVVGYDGDGHVIPGGTLVPAGDGAFERRGLGCLDCAERGEP